MMEFELTPRQHKAISALLLAPTLKAAAEQAGCNERTLRGWLGEPTFVAAYQTARRQAVGQAAARLQQASGEAVATLLALLDCGSSAVRLGAARAILELAHRAIELEDIEARLAALEARYAEPDQ